LFAPGGLTIAAMCPDAPSTNLVRPGFAALRIESDCHALSSTNLCKA
jgi:hypothetical protein